ncbi:P-loop NTPase fold protein [Mesoplasma melaleucae]|uniref:KAP NTPase domain-containing protein n=1 Tax=Mesoplasma melaleucae TaxID=81459 RepID=A0A2K8NVC9_9MOLU|nr:P-loop NTPase fold protein [Mesoplasma melaleucae]ATZ17792.1 hypothetical protein EMELA_v1c02190 [Mesoplasma melaleucae]
MNNELIKNIETYIRNKENNNIALSGLWGSGKTTIIDKVADNLKEDYQIIKLDLWNYELYEEEVFCQIILDIMLGLNFDENNFKNIFANSIKLFAKDVPVAILESVLTNFFEKNNLNKVLEVFKKSIRNIFKSSIFNELSENYQKIIFNKKQIDYLIFLMNENFSEYFKKNDKEKILIIFEDLERCSELNIIKILTYIKNVLIKCSKNNLNFVTIINKNQIASILKYKDEEYIEKVFEKIIDINKFTKFSNEIYKNNFKNELDEIELELINHFSDNLNFRIFEKYQNIISNLKNKNDKYFVLWLFLLKNNKSNKYNNYFDNYYNKKKKNENEIKSFYEEYLIFNANKSNLYSNKKSFFENFHYLDLINWKAENTYKIDGTKFKILSNIGNGISKSYSFDNFIIFLNIYEKINFKNIPNCLKNNNSDFLFNSNIIFHIELNNNSLDIFDNDFKDFFLILNSKKHLYNIFFNIAEYISNLNLEYVYFLLES